ncbi:DUF2167 domain-containing protein [uncultured Aquitalea sp.]|uniref:DUF2167 domain-containing protein n=1 Tax=uncultured Aquitalea sp. TaxID=540272 RepID=UPI0025FE8C77|nr:DUF2167 domain-containing protein [uncultured Aquitalea sp.]
MKKNTLLLLLALAFPVTALAEGEADSAFDKLNWHTGPRQETIVNRGALSLNAEQSGLDEKDSSEFLRLTKNLPEPGNIIIVSKQGWWSDFSFDPMGYVKDDEKIDADAILKSIKDSDEPSNEERAKQGMPALHTLGWHTPPHYDPVTHQLEWAIRVSSGNVESVNYTVRILGREGVMNAVLVTDTQTLDRDLPQFKKMLATYNFNAGQKYSEFKPGDHVAELGLGALIIGGAAAVATKKGFWAVLGAALASGWKLIAAACLGAGAWLKSLFSRKKQS